LIIFFNDLSVDAVFAVPNREIEVDILIVVFDKAAS